MDDDRTRAKVAGDLFPFYLPYTAVILEARGYGPARGGWAAAVLAARSSCSSGTGTEPTAFPVVTGAATSSPPRPLPPAVSDTFSVGKSGGGLTVSLDPVKHRDIPDAAFDHMDHIPSDLFPQSLARVAACDIKELRGYTTGTLVTGLCHTMASLGDWISQCANEHPGVSPRHSKELVKFLGRRNTRAGLLRKVGVVAGETNRRQQHKRDLDVYQKKPPAERFRGPPGPGWCGPSSVRR